MKKYNKLLEGLVASVLMFSVSTLFAAASDKAVEIAQSFERFDESEEYFGFLQENCMSVTTLKTGLAAWLLI